VSPPGRTSAQLAEQRPDVVHQEVGRLHGGEVAAPVELAPLDTTSIGIDFTVTGPPELVAAVEALATRCARAIA